MLLAAILVVVVTNNNNEVEMDNPREQRIVEGLNNAGIKVNTETWYCEHKNRPIRLELWQDGMSPVINLHVPISNPSKTELALGVSKLFDPVLYVDSRRYPPLQIGDLELNAVLYIGGNSASHAHNILVNHERLRDILLLMTEDYPRFWLYLNGNTARLETNLTLQDELSLRPETWLMMFEFISRFAQAVEHEAGAPRARQTESGQFSSMAFQ